MQSTIERLEDLSCKVKVNIPKEEVEKTYQTHLKEAAKQVQLKGFRPGKVPMDVIKKRFGSQIEQDVMRELIDSSFREAISEHKLQVAGEPRFSKKPELVVGQPLVYEAQVETIPEVELKDLNNLSIEKITAEVTEEDVARMLKTLQERNANYKAVSRAAKNGDQVVIDFDGVANGQKIEHGSAKGFRLLLGSQQMIPGFEDGIVGMKPEESKEINVTFPEEYIDKNIAGKPAIFTVTLHSVEEPQLPSIDEELPKKLQVKGGYEELKNEVRKQMEKGLDQTLSHRLRSAVLDKLLELNPITLPKQLVEREARFLKQSNQAQHEMMQKQYGTKIPMQEAPLDLYMKEAEKRVRLGLLLAEVIKRHDIQRDQNKVREKIKTIASNYPNSENVERHYYQNKELMAEVEAAVLEEQVVDKLLETAKVADKMVSYDEVMKNNP